jgi:hypothetical protein
VQCPHCRSIVQTHAASPPAAPPEAANWLEKPPIPNEVPHQESIFTEHDASDSILGEAPTPKVQMPGDLASPATAALTESMPTATSAPPEGSNSGTQLPKFQPRPIYDKSTISISLLIFLIPYAILTTCIILYLLLSGNGSRSDPFEYLRDPVKKDGPKRVQHPHNERLSPRLRTTLGKPIQAGDLLVTFNKVRLTADGDLQLVLRAKNTSSNTAFEPINDFYVKVDHNRRDSKPYTFLESRSKDGVDHIYNMYLSFFKDSLAKQEQSSGKLNPKEETTIVLTTDFPYRDKHIAKMLKSNDEYTWRIQVRRGFVRVDGKEVPATMVIGLDFTGADIERAKT